MAGTPEDQSGQPDQREAHSLDSPETTTGSDLKRTFAQTDIHDVSAAAVTGTPSKRQAVDNTSEGAALAATGQSRVDETLVLGYRIESALCMRLPADQYELYNKMTLDDTTIEEVHSLLLRQQ